MPPFAAQNLIIRPIVRDYIVAALERQKPNLEMYVAEHLEYPEAFPLVLDKPAVTIRWTGRVNIVQQFQTDYPPVDVTAALRVALTAESRRRDVASGVRTAAVPDAVLGLRTFDMDVELKAIGAAVSRGYDLTPQSARLTAWWGATPRYQ